VRQDREHRERVRWVLTEKRYFTSKSVHKGIWFLPRIGGTLFAKYPAEDGPDLPGDRSGGRKLQSPHGTSRRLSSPAPLVSPREEPVIEERTHLSPQGRLTMKWLLSVVVGLMVGVVVLSVVAFGASVDTPKTPPRIISR